MPLARIVTRHPESTGFLTDYLNARGYSVEVAEPESLQNTFADLEITLEDYTREQALARAAELASTLDADVLVGPDVLAPRNVIRAPEPQQSPVLEQSRNEPLAKAVPIPEPAMPPREPLLTRCARTMRVYLAQKRQQWQTFTNHSGERFARYTRAFSDISSAAGRRSSLIAAKLATTCNQELQVSRKQITETGKKLQATWLRARTALQQRIQMHQQLKAEQQQTERQRLLEVKRQEQQQAQETGVQATISRQQQEREAHEAALREQRGREEVARLTQVREQEGCAIIPSAHRFEEDEDGEGELLPLTARPPVRSMPLRPTGQPRSSLIAYARSRDWKMAFAGAAAATLMIMLAFGLFAHRTSPSAPQAEQKLPFGAAAVANPPSLILPPANVVKPAISPVHVAMEKPKPHKPQNMAAAEEFDQEGDYSEAEVVVRHFPRSQAATAHTDHDGVKRISDLE